VVPITLPPRSRGLIQLDSFVWVFAEDRVLPANVVENRTRITATVVEVTPETLRSVWQEID
jgi:hypothetical protein